MGLLHAVSHLTVVLGLGAGAVSFLQTVKASEACFTALLSHLFLGQVWTPRTASVWEGGGGSVQEGKQQMARLLYVVV